MKIYILEKQVYNILIHVHLLYFLSKNSPTALVLICFALSITCNIAPIISFWQQFILLYVLEHSVPRLSDSHIWRSCDWMSGNQCSNIMAACVFWTSRCLVLSNSVSTTCKLRPWCRFLDKLVLMASQSSLAIYPDKLCCFHSISSIKTLISLAVYFYILF